MLSLFKANRQHEYTESTPEENETKKYEKLIYIVERELSGIYTYDSAFYEWSDAKILKLQLLYLEGIKNILLRDIFYEHVLSEIEEGSFDPLEIYPEELVSNLKKEEISTSLLGKCILMNYKKAHSIAEQLERVCEGNELTGQRCYLYKYLNIGVTGSGGNHRVIAADMMGYDMKAPLTIIDDEPLVKSLNTDGNHWISNDGKIVGRVHNYKIGAVFTITKVLLLKDISILKNNTC